MRKQNIILVILTVAAMGLASCSQESDNGIVSDNREVNFQMGISRTRTVTVDKVTSFTEGDQVGIFAIERGATKVFNKNAQYTYTQGNRWTAESSITFPLTGENLNFYAYYPYVDTQSAGFDFTVSADQSAAGGYAQSDLLLAKNESSIVGDASIALNFVRPMAMVEVRPTLPGGSQLELQKVVLTAVPTATVNLQQQTAVLKASVKAIEITLMKVNDGVYRAVVPAQTLNGRILMFAGINTSTGLSTHFEYSLPESKQLSANKITVFAINL